MCESQRNVPKVQRNVPFTMTPSWRRDAPATVGAGLQLDHVVDDPIEAGGNSASATTAAALRGASPRRDANGKLATDPAAAKRSIDDEPVSTRSERLPDGHAIYLACGPGILGRGYATPIDSTGVPSSATVKSSLLSPRTSRPERSLTTTSTSTSVTLDLNVGLGGTCCIPSRRHTAAMRFHGATPHTSGRVSLMGLEMTASAR